MFQYWKNSSTTIRRVIVTTRETGVDEK